MEKIQKANYIDLRKHKLLSSLEKVNWAFSWITDGNFEETPDDEELGCGCVADFPGGKNEHAKKIKNWKKYICPSCSDE